MNRMTLLLVLSTLFLLLIPASAQDNSPVFSDLPAGEWTQIDVEDGVCLYNTDYSFFVRPNETPTNNLMIYFQGGGACWDGLTCGSVGVYATVYDIFSDQINLYTQGIFSFDNSFNPVSGYNIVFLPYCSGDLHMGSTQTTFDVPPEATYNADQIDVVFNGFNNSQLVLDWVYENFEFPSRILVTGCSAGGYGALHHSAYIMDNYRGVPTAVIIDAAAGIQGKNWDGFDTWGVFDNMPDFIPELADMTLEEYSMTAYFEGVAQAFPHNRFAQFNSYLDETQVSFFLTAGARDLPEGVESNYYNNSAYWSQELMQNTERLSQLSNYRHYVAGGHCTASPTTIFSTSITRQISHSQNGIWMFCVVLLKTFHAMLKKQHVFLLLSRINMITRG